MKKDIIGYSAYNIYEAAYKYNEDKCFISDSPESLMNFIEGTGFSIKNYKTVRVQLSDIMRDYALCSGRYCMEPEALKRFEKAARPYGIHYSIEEYNEDLINLEVTLPRSVYNLKKPNEESTISEPASKINIIDWDIMTFSCQKNRFLVFMEFCTNPSCPSKDILFSFVEADERLKPVANPLSFFVRLDLRRGKEISPPERSEDVNKLVGEFLNLLTQEMKADLLSQIDYVRKDEKRLSRYKMNKQDVLDGVLVSYTDIVSDTGSFIKGGKESSFRFSHKGREYLVEDLYCSNPDCKCEKIYFQFFELIRENAEDVYIVDRFMAKMTFDGRMRILELFKCNPRDAQELMRAWKAQHPRVLGILKERYKKIKTIGSKTLESKDFFEMKEPSLKPDAKKIKIGRNEPCPCGSGKKYKKCCGS